MVPELLKKYHHRMQWTRRVYELTAADAAARVDADRASEWALERARECPAPEFGMGDLERLMDHDPAEANRRWEEVKAAARDELRTGQRAAAALEAPGCDLWQRAQFLAVRQDLADQLAPTGGLEWALLATMAQALSEYLRWLNAARDWGEWEGSKERPDKGDPYALPPLAPRMTYADAADRSHELADRYNRLFLRNLRAFRDHRRLMGPLNITAGQVNISAGPQQVNVHGGPLAATSSGNG